MKLAPPTDKARIMILGSGPNRIGQGIEFDYCCVQATFALRDAGFETTMVNCNPETVSTDYDTADRLPRELILGTSPTSIDMAEDRERWNALCARLEIPQPAGGTAATIEDAL